VKGEVAHSCRHGTAPHSSKVCIGRGPQPAETSGIRHRLVSILVLAAAAVVAGARSYTAAGQWAAHAPAGVRGYGLKDCAADHGRFKVAKIGNDASSDVRRHGMAKRVRTVAGRPRDRLSDKPPAQSDSEDNEQPRKRHILLWPFRSLWNLLGTVAVAIILGYLSTQQGLIFDKVERDVFDSPPLEFYQYSKPSDYIQSYSWVSDDILTVEEARSDGHAAIRKLADADKAFPRGRTSVGFILKGTRSEPVTITQMTATVTRRTPAPSAMLVNTPPTGGPTSVVRVGFDLDSPTKVARKIEPTSGNPFALGNPLLEPQHFTLTKGEELSFSFNAETARPEVLHWEIEIRVKDHNHEQIVTLDGPGFVVSGGVDNYTKIYDQRLSGGEWYLGE